MYHPPIRMEVLISLAGLAAQPPIIGGIIPPIGITCTRPARRPRSQPVGLLVSHQYQERRNRR